MDLEEWELLPRDGLINLDDEFERTTTQIRTAKSDQRIVFNKDYFLCPSPKSHRKLPEPSSSPIRPKVIEVPIWLEPPKFFCKEAEEDGKIEQELIKKPIDVTVVPSPKINQIDQDVVSQVFFKKLKENEFADMKLDSPNATSPRANNTLPQLETDSFGFDDKIDCVMQTKLSSPRKNGERGNVGSTKCPDQWDEDIENGGLNLWKWSLNGIGAIFSFGVAAASFCIIILRSQKQQEQKMHRLRFQIYADEKKMKEVVQHATKLNKALSAVRGVPVTTAHISFGGYYNGI